MDLDLKRQAGLILALCIITSGCGEKLALPSNEAENFAAQVVLGQTSGDEAEEDVLADRKPRKILSPDEKRRAANLLKIYRDSRPTGSGDSEEALLSSTQNRLLVQEALDKIDPKIMDAERRREAALNEQEFDRRVEALIREQDKKTANNP